MLGEASGSTATQRLQVDSEVGVLRSVLLHRPGAEIDNLTPGLLREMLFEDIPYLPAMREEHDRFAALLRAEDVQVNYLEDLLAEVLAQEETRFRFIGDLLRESGAAPGGVWEHDQERLSAYLRDLSPEQLVRTAIGGLRRSDLPARERRHLSDFLTPAHPFYLLPMPNLYFMRDPAAMIGSGVLVNHMFHPARQRESLLLAYVTGHHPLFTQDEPPRWYDRSLPYPVEGGDILVLSPDVVAIGMGERTGANAVEHIAVNLFLRKAAREVLAFQLPRQRAFMHLDTVLTMVSRQQFAVHSLIVNEGLPVFRLSPGRDGSLRIEETAGVEEAISTALGVGEIDLIPTGGGDPIASEREQWNDGANTLAVRPGVIVAYERNEASNAEMQRHGVQVLVLEGGELSRGRGGPRCMTMPLRREPL